MKPKAIVFDLDGTVLNSNKQISKRNIKAINKIAQSNIHIIFATARPPRVAVFDEFDIRELGYMVYYNGAYFRCTETLDDCHFGIEASIGASVIDYVDILDEKAIITIEIKNKLYGYKKIDYAILDFMKKNFYPEIVDVKFLKSQELTKILIADFQYAKELASKFSDDLNIIVTDNGRLVQIMSNQVGKEIAVSTIAKNLKISMKEIMCFGDDYNDLKLFLACGYSVAMGNSIEELKSIASEVALSNDEDGVAVVLERILSKM